MRLVLVNTYDLGRQPFGLASPAAWLRQAGHEVRTVDLSRERMPAVPDVPTLVEQGYPEFVVSTWIGMIAPAGMPRDMVAKLNREINTAYALPEVREKIEAMGLIPGSDSLEAFAKVVKSDAEVYARIIRDAKISLQ